MHMVILVDGKLLPHLEQSVPDHEDPKAQEMLERDMREAMDKNAIAYGLTDYEIRAIEDPADYLALREALGATVEEVKGHAGALIDKIYPAYKRENIAADFGMDSDEYREMRAYINAVRAASNEIERDEIIALSFRDDPRWPASR